MLQTIDDDQLLENVMMKLDSSEVATKRPRPQRDALSWTLPGFVAGARVATSFGNLPIEALRLRDPVRTISGDYLPVKWIDKIQLDTKFLSLHPEANPIFIPQGSLAPMAPNSDILVSPVQNLKLPKHTSGTPAISAQSIVGRGNIARKSQQNLTYYLFHCGEDTSISIDGLWFEILHK
ncbi:hypothetical protein C1J03_21940 [Sulfitobacter sp. SK012]|uniref:Hint domain-containing protein n=1 Tax=Sulfitobacter sp. SK012 TaxID=1389005 RepID=UPI000E0A2F30|nr:Hint domain-containing protein [Sulfitobacter sp. SK012]AXI48417.1 hypothetical protein C1J03_21940 [Sulfitobacter sp. SK012]